MAPAPAPDQADRRLAIMTGPIEVLLVSGSLRAESVNTAVLRTAASLAGGGVRATLAIRRGDLSRGLDVELALDVLGGAIFYRLLVTGGPIDQRLAQGIVELILRGFAPRNKRAPAGANPKERRQG
jgi:hypothetical protein